jgi:hypothetical protein
VVEPPFAGEGHLVTSFSSLCISGQAQATRSSEDRPPSNQN